MRGLSFNITVGNGRQRGAVLVLFAACLLAMLCVLGLTIDTAMAYSAKSRLSLAADSAVLAAANAYAHDTNAGTRKQSAENAADAYFAANYPGGFLGTRSSAGKLEINGTHLTYHAQSESPLTLASVMSSKNLPLVTAPEVTLAQFGGKVNIVLVLDESSSITALVWNGHCMQGCTDPTTSPAFAASIAAMFYRYIDQFDSANTRVAVLPFGSPKETTVALKFREQGFDPQEVKAKIWPYLGGNTATATALELAIKELDRISKAQPDHAKNIILLATDGLPTGQGNPDAAMAVQADILHRKNIALYSIGYGPEFKSPQEDKLKCMTGDRNHRPQTACPSKIYPDSKYCLTADHDLARCLAVMPLVTQTPVLIR
jgi:Flp pilus assembly protein TadG